MYSCIWSRIEGFKLFYCYIVTLNFLGCRILVMLASVSWSIRVYPLIITCMHVRFMTFGYITSHSHPPHSLPTHTLTLTPSHSPPPHSQLFLPGQPLPSRLRVEVQSIKGDADLFLSQSCTAPSQVRYTWCDQDVGGSEFCLSVDDKDYDVNKVCVCVCLRACMHDCAWVG